MNEPLDHSRRRRPRVPVQARQRAVRACTGCRRLKERCDGDGGQPCIRCARTNKQCEYTTTTTQQLPSSHTSDDAERLQCLEQIATHFLGNVPLNVHNLRRIANRIVNQPEADGAASEVDLHHELDHLALDEEQFAVKAISSNVAHYSGEFSHWNFSQKVRRRLSECLNTPQTQSSADILGGSHDEGCESSSRAASSHFEGKTRILEYWRATQLQSPNLPVMSLLGLLPPRQVADCLAQSFFQFAQPNTFFVQRTWLVQKLDLLYQAPTDLSSADSAWVCVIIMVLAGGAQFAHMAPQNRQEQSTCGIDTSHTFYSMATALVPDVITIASLESVQAFLLFANYTLPLDTQGLAYTYLGLAIRMAVQNGMHRKYTGTDLDAWTIETRNRLWWMAYSMEKRVSVLHGRPVSITLSELDVELPKDIAELREHDEAKTFQNILALIELTAQLGEFASAISCLRRCPKGLQAAYFQRLVDMRGKLRSWWSAAPRDAQNSTTTSPLFRANAHLKLYYHIVEIFIGRPFMLVSPKQATITTTASLEGHEASSKKPSGRASLVTGAVTAAFQVIDLLHVIQISTGLARTSYTEFSSCRAALLVLLAQSLDEQTDRLRSSIDLGMALLRSMAAGNILSARSETSVIEALEEAIRRLHARRQLEVRNQVKYVDSTDHGLDEHARFQEWASLWDGNHSEQPQPYMDDLFLDPIPSPESSESLQLYMAAQPGYLLGMDIDGFNFDTLVPNAIVETQIPGTK